MIANRFSHIQTWVFDLDNTLYPPEACLFDLIEVRMTNWVMKTLGVERAHADYLRQHYWETYGTTLAGLMREHNADPAPYLHDVHDVPMERMTPDPELAALIYALPGRKIVYTNGSAPYANRVLEARGLDGIFDAIYGVEHADFLPKPERSAFDLVFARDGLDPSTAAMFEDDARNLITPHALGMRTVYVSANTETAPHIHHQTQDLTAFLRQLAPVNRNIRKAE